MDYADAVVKSAWARGDESALDMMWYLWCGNNSPFSGRVFHTFERAVVDDKSTWVEPKNPYFSHWEDEDAVRMILAEFGLDPERGHIINGHTPVKAKKGESPVKAGGQAVHNRRRLLQGVSGHDRHRWLHADIQLARHPAQEPPSLRGRRQGAQRERGHGVRFRARRVFPDAAVHIRHRRGRAPAPEDRGVERAAGGLPGRSAAAEQIKRERERGA